MQSQKVVVSVAQVEKPVGSYYYSQVSLLQENLQVIHRFVDELINVKNLEEKVAEKQPSVIELQCMQCSSPSFKLEEFISFETGIICPFCGYFYSILVDKKVEKNEIL